MSENSTAGGVILQRLEELLGVISEALGIADKLGKLFPAERNKKVVDEVIDPIFLTMVEVHDAYVHVFNHAISLMPSGSPGEFSVAGANPRAITDDEAKTILDGVRDSFRNKSGDFEGKRTSIRAQAETYIKAFDQGSPERAFIWAVLNYFLRADLDGKPVAEIARHADYIAEVGSDTALSTPASGTLVRIANESDPEKILKILVQEKNALSNRFSDVARCYHRVIRRLKKIK